MAYVAYVLMILATWGVPAAWIALQATALLGLRGASQVLSLPPLIGLIVVIQITFTGWKQDSNLWPLLLIFASPIGALWNLLCILLGDAEASRKKKLIKIAALLTVGMLAVLLVVAGIAGTRRNAARERYEREGEEILRALGPDVLLGAPQGTDLHLLDAASVRRTIESGSDAYRHCYEAGRRTQPGVAGSFFVRLTIRMDGRVEAASVTLSSGATLTEQCIVERMKGLEFSPTSTSAVSITVPLLLEPYSRPK